MYIADTCRSAYRQQRHPNLYVAVGESGSRGPLPQLLRARCEDLWGPAQMNSPPGRHPHPFQHGPKPSVLFPSPPSYHTSPSPVPTAEGRMASQALISGVIQHQVARQCSWALTHPAPFPAPAQGMTESGSRHNHSGKAATGHQPPHRSQEPHRVIQRPLPPRARHHQSCQRQWPGSTGTWSASSQGLRTVSLTWIIIPFALYSACRALEKVHTKACSEKEKLHQNQLPQSPESRRSSPSCLKTWQLL